MKEEKEINVTVITLFEYIIFIVLSNHTPLVLISMKISSFA